MSTALVEVEQEFIRPGAYDVPGGRREFTAEEFAAFAADTNRAIESGFEIPVLDKHTPLGASDEDHEEAARGTDGKGWLRGVRQLESGALAYRLAVTPDVKQGIDEGRIKFTSPYFWPGYKSADGKVAGNLIRHVAITPKPRTQNQGPFVPVGFSEANSVGWQFSLEDAVQVDSKADKKLLTMAILKELGCYLPPDLEVSLDEADFDACLKVLGIVNEARKAAEAKMKEDRPQAFAEGDGEEGEGSKKAAIPTKKDGDGEGDPAEPASPDSGGVDLGGLISQVAAELNVSIPEGIDPKSESGLAIILVAVLNAAKASKQAPAAGGAGPTVKEEPMATAQFSEHPDPAVRALAKKVNEMAADKARAAAAAGRAALQAEIATIQAKGLRDRLSSMVGGVQFSESGIADDRGQAILACIRAFRECIPAGVVFSEATPKEEPHPDGTQFFDGGKGEPTPEEAEATARRIHAGSRAVMAAK